MEKKNVQNTNSKGISSMLSPTFLANVFKNNNSTSIYITSVSQNYMTMFLTTHTYTPAHTQRHKEIIRDGNTNFLCYVKQWLFSCDVHGKCGRILR